MDSEDDLFQTLDDSWRQLKTQRLEKKPYFTPSEEPLSWDYGAKVIRLDVAIMALHLAHARANTRSLADRFATKLRALKETMAGWERSAAGKALVKITFKELIGKVLGRILYVVNLFRYVELQQGIERDIRRAAIRTLREAYNDCLAKKAKVRKRKLVSTRHKSKPQRRPNKSWRSPRSK